MSTYTHYVLTCEQSIINQWLARTFGYYLLHMGDPSFQGLAQSNRIRYSLYLDIDEHQEPAYPTHCKSTPEALPIASDSVDVILLTHALEGRVEALDDFLAEIHRILIPEGTLIITGSHAKISLVRWCLALKAYDFQIQSGHLLCFTPRVLVNMGIELPLLEKIGPYCAPFLSNTYALLVSKKCVGMTPIRPQWTKKMILKDNKVWGNGAMGTKFNKGKS